MQANRFQGFSRLVLAFPEFFFSITTWSFFVYTIHIYIYICIYAFQEKTGFSGDVHFTH